MRVTPLRKAHIVVANDKLKVTVVCLGVKFSFYQRDGKIILYYINPFAKSGIEDKNRLRVNSTERGHGVKQLSN
jgi:hypothetical protein